MPDWTIQIILNAPTHAIGGDPSKEQARFRRGDVVDAIRSNTFATLSGGNYTINEGIGGERFGYIHIKGIPPALSTNFRVRMTKRTGETKEILLKDPDTGFMVPYTQSDPWRMRKWRFRIPQLTAPKRNALINNKEITLTWTAARDKLVRKVLTNRADPDSDTEEVVVDGDLS